MTPGARASAAIGILDRILAGTPVEQALTNWARAARYAGSGDRAEVRDIVFQCLRCRSSYAARGGGLTGRGLVLGLHRATGDAAPDIFTGGPHDPAPPDPKTDRAREPVGAEVHDVPDWLEPVLRRSLGQDFEAIAERMRDRAPVYLRVNPLRADRAGAVSLLAEDGIDASPCEAAPLALIVRSGGRRIKTSKAFAQGVIELQDLSSQAVVAALPLQDGMRVLDHCAGGGGKTLAMAAEARLRLFAHDVAPKRMADIPVRAQRAGVKISLTEKPETSAPYDLVLVDAPCSGSGSWRRDPEAKWKLSPDRLTELTGLQADIMDRASAMVATGGWLAYATCSLLQEENQTQAMAFLDRHRGWALSKTLSFTPLTHSDGFFLALFQRRA
ncbi:MAG: RsmB/NOP family class I SAM-dependent RNA methyltransferase [Tabrizicola sp.]|nr:RsmB/NOP family class I SAM-dependent RNA methyltransferase [Tabrizicola sp.]